jgi:hypothetical protein
LTLPKRPETCRYTVFHISDSSKKDLPRHLTPQHLKHYYEGELTCTTMSTCTWALLFSLCIRACTHVAHPLKTEGAASKACPYDKWVGLARTVYIHCIWPFSWWFPCQQYRIYTVYIWFWPTLIVCELPPPLQFDPDDLSSGTCLGISLDAQHPVFSGNRNDT